MLETLIKCRQLGHQPHVLDTHSLLIPGLLLKGRAHAWDDKSFDRGVIAVPEDAFAVPAVNCHLPNFSDPLDVFNADLHGVSAGKANRLCFVFDLVLMQLKGRAEVVLALTKFDHILDDWHFGDIFKAAVAAVLVRGVFTQNCIYRLAAWQFDQGTVAACIVKL